MEELISLASKLRSHGIDPVEILARSLAAVESCKNEEELRRSPGKTLRENLRLIFHPVLLGMIFAAARSQRWIRFETEDGTLSSPIARVEKKASGTEEGRSLLVSIHKALMNEEGHGTALELILRARAWQLEIFGEMQENSVPYWKALARVAKRHEGKRKRKPASKEREKGIWLERRIEKAREKAKGLGQTSMVPTISELKKEATVNKSRY